jgi:transposase-like protein
MPTHKSNDYKLTAVQYYLVEDTTQEEVCKIFKCSPRSLMRWVNQYKKEGNVNKHYRKPIAYKVKKEYRNEKIKALVNKHNNILYAVPYQHFTNSIENYFSMLKSQLQKLDGLTYNELKKNIEKVIKEIPREKYENIFKGAYERPEKYVSKNKTRKIKKQYK